MYVPGLPHTGRDDTHGMSSETSIIRAVRDVDGNRINDAVVRERHGKRAFPRDILSRRSLSHALIYSLYRRPARFLLSTGCRASFSTARPMITELKRIGAE